MGKIENSLKIGSTTRQILGRVNRFAVAAHFKVQHHTLCIRVAHVGNTLTFAHGLVFFDQQRLVVCVSGEVGVVVLQDDQIAVAAQARASVNNTAIGRRINRVTQFASDFQTLAFDIVVARYQ